MGKPKILLILGASGSGKSTLAENLVATDSKRYKHLVSMTSREPREGEVDGEDYYFRDEVTIREYGAKGELIAEVHNQFSNIYGTHVSELNKKKTNIIVVSMEGLLDVLTKVARKELKANVEVLCIKGSPFVERSNRAATEEEKYINCMFENLMKLTKTHYGCVTVDELRKIGNGEYQLRKLMKELKL